MYFKNVLSVVTLKMIHIVVRDGTLLRAFPTKEDAVLYKKRKQLLLHEHCCLCEDCPNISYYAEHDRFDYDCFWTIFDTSLNNPEGILFIVTRDRKIDKAFHSYEEAEEYKKEMEIECKELEFNDSWDIKFCNYSSKFSNEGDYEIDDFNYIEDEKIDNQL